MYDFGKQGLEELAGELGIAGNVVFTGFVPEEDLPMIYQLSHCFIIASIAELLSLATLQAMASGLPVIAVRAGALEELVHERINGLLFDAGDVESMVSCMEEMIGNDALRSKMSSKNLEYIKQHDIHESVKSFERIYERLGRGAAGDNIKVRFLPCRN